MERKLLSLMALVIVGANVISPLRCAAQEEESAETTQRTTMYEKNQKAVVLMNTGQTINLRSANIFLKNGALVYKKGATTLEAEMSGIESVDFPDRTYIKVDTALAYVVDTVDNKKLLCSTLIDMDAYTTILLNSREMTNLQMTSFMNITTMESMDEASTFPLMRVYYYQIDGKILNVHERPILKYADKDKRRLITNIIQQPDFSWKNEESLMEILKLL